MRTLIVSSLAVFLVFLSSGGKAEELVKPGPKEKGMHDMHIMMRMMNQGLCTAIEGANLKALGQMGMSENMDSGLIARGEKMLHDGKNIIEDVLDKNGMSKLHQEGGYEHSVMKSLHELGQQMLQVIEKAEKLDEHIHKPGFYYIEKQK